MTVYQLNDWSGKSAINILIGSINPEKKVNLNLIGFLPAEKKAVILKLSGEIILDVPKEFGAWQLESIYGLGEEENPKIGSKLLQLSASKLLGLPVDAVVLFGNKERFSNPENLIADLRKNPLILAGILNGVDTNLTPFQAYRVFWMLSKVRSDKIIALDLAKSSITESKLLPDSSRVLGVDMVKLDYFIRENMAELSEEDKSIAIFNGTSFAGIAQEASRIVTNMGGSVITVSNTEQKFASTMVVSKDGENKGGYTYQRMSQIFAPQCLKENCQSKDPKILFSRADVNIILGEDYFNLWYRR